MIFCPSTLIGEYIMWQYDVGNFQPFFQCLGKQFISTKLQDYTLVFFLFVLLLKFQKLGMYDNLQTAIMAQL